MFADLRLRVSWMYMVEGASTDRQHAYLEGAGCSCWCINHGRRRGRVFLGSVAETLAAGSPLIITPPSSLSLITCLGTLADIFARYNASHTYAEILRLPPSKIKAIIKLANQGQELQKPAHHSAITVRRTDSTTPSHPAFATAPTRNNMASHQRTFSHSQSQAGAKEKTYFEQQREELIGEIAMSFEHVLANINKLNLSLETVITSTLFNTFGHSTSERFYKALKVLAKDHDFASALPALKEARESRKAGQYGQRVSPKSDWTPIDVTNAAAILLREVLETLASAFLSDARSEEPWGLHEDLDSVDFIIPDDSPGPRKGSRLSYEQWSAAEAARRDWCQRIWEQREEQTRANIAELE
ncbi:putative DASH complex subunit Dad1 [Colletotrichum sublineola]|uniref:DASH complex subunit DAD1 n=1 Tax=Colletotrichum sublineola TaxID=1173701 RepID=A0A066X822_COLSU|nr:putative DASH complex subunit Dad1 [Colletotrichum sublineola]